LLDLLGSIAAAAARWILRQVQVGGGTAIIVAAAIIIG